MICPLCNGKLQSIIESTGIRPQYCPRCDKIWVGDDSIITQDRHPGDKNTKESIPELSIGTVVYVTNKEHKFFLEIGTITEKDHLHYRVRFDSKDKGIDQRHLWLPAHWVAEMPNDMIRK